MNGAFLNSIILRCVFAIVILTGPLFKRASLYSEVLPHCNEVIPNSFIRLSVLLVTSFINAVVRRGFAPIFPDTCYHLTHYWPAAADIPVASDNPVHYAGAIRYNARTPLQGSLLPLTRLV